MTPSFTPSNFIVMAVLFVQLPAFVVLEFRTDPSDRGFLPDRPPVC
jgi:hypothetical protein